MSITKVSPDLLDLDAGITISVADNSDNLTLTSTDDDANSGPNLRLYRNSSSPTDDDVVGRIDFEGRNDNSQDVIYANIQGEIMQESDGSEDGQLQFGVMKAGTLTNAMMIDRTAIIINEDSVDLDFRVESNGNANMLFVDGGNDKVGIGTNSPTQTLDVVSTSAGNTTIPLVVRNSGSTSTGTESKLFLSTVADEARGAFVSAIITDSSNGNALLLGTNTAGASPTERMRIDSSGNIQIVGGNQMTQGLFFYNGGDSHLLSGIRNKSNSSYNDSGGLEFLTSGTSNAAESVKMSIDTQGNVGIGTTSPAQLLHVETTASPIATFRYNSSNRVDIRYDGLDTYGGNFRMMLAGSEQFRFGTTGVLGVSTTTLKSAGDNPTDENSAVLGPGYLYLQRDDSASINQIIFGKDGQTVGNIITTTATSYVSASDYRMKENVDYTWDATSRLKQLKPARYNWIADETNTLEDGFLAHEVATVVPNAVFGEKDAVDSNGNPEMQGVDPGKLIPLLVKTIQELEARITTLEG